MARLLGDRKVQVATTQVYGKNKSKIFNVSDFIDNKLSDVPIIFSETNSAREV